ncbi:hypothetical protein ACQKLX_19175 [Bosea sp. NPDC003192]|uniref:hypothetical protein n=1 Tax=Bosea sp. NPDC003192 TaxID=3390551 RepID=UPI003CFC27A1
MLGLDPSISGRRLLVRRFSGLRYARPENDGKSPILHLNRLASCRLGRIVVAGFGSTGARFPIDPERIDRRDFAPTSCRPIRSMPPWTPSPNAC